VVGRNNQAVDYPITINVQGAPPPASINFWADNTNLNAGECTTLRWDVQNVREVYLDNQGVAGQGSQQVCPGSTTTYTLRVVRTDGGQETRQLTVNVANTPPPQPAPIIDGFSVSANQISVGQCVNINWNTRYTDHINLSRSGQIIMPGGAAAGSIEDCPSSPGLYDYSLDAYGNGQVSQTVSVEVQ
jgi:hypothetical protein